MINKSKGNERSTFIAENIDAETITKQFIDAPVNAARQPTIDLGLELLAFMTALPDALIASEERELKRLTRTSDNKNDARIEQLKASIVRTQDIRSNTNQGKSRIERVLVSLSAEGNIFHGFVSDTNANPRKGLTVRISVRGNEKSEATRSATTDADGYFSIPLGSEKTDRTKKAAPISTVNLSDRVAELLTRTNAKADAAAGTNADGTPASGAENETRDPILARVEILDGINVIYQDGSPLVINNGTAYREYIVESKDEPRSDQRYVGNAVTRELHDTEKLTKQCNFAKIKKGSHIYFDTTAAAEASGYDYCAYCFGKEKSKH